MEIIWIQEKRQGDGQIMFVSIIMAGKTRVQAETQPWRSSVRCSDLTNSDEDKVKLIHTYSCCKAMFCVFGESI